MADGGPAWVRLTVRALLACSAGVMAAGFLTWQAGVLVAGLAALSFVLAAVVPVSAGLSLPYGRGHLLRELRRHGYLVLPDTSSRYLLVGSGGAYLLDTRVWQHVVSRGAHEWLLGDLPAPRVVHGMVGYATRLERAAGMHDRASAPRIVPVIMVAGRLPEPVMRTGWGVLARPRHAVRYLSERPEVLSPTEVTDLAGAVERCLRAR